MLQAIRVHSQGWFAWLIVALISIPFALWGIQEYIRVGSQQPIAKVNGHDIEERDLNQRVQRTRLELRSRLGKAYRPEMIEQNQLKKEVLEGMIRSQLILEHSLSMGLRVGDGQIRAVIMAIPAFQQDGKFDSDAYQQILSRQGITSLQFEDQIRMNLMTSQLSRVVSASEFATEWELAETVRLRNQRRSFKYFLLSPEQFKTDSPIAEAELQKYYQRYRGNFETPEQVKVDYLLLGQSADTTASKLEVPEADLQALYQSKIAQYRTPEQRQIRHILITINTNATPEDEAAAKKRIADIRTRIVGGADFATVAKEVSEDPGSAPQGGDLGLVAKGIMVPEFEQAAFALPQGVLSEPVRSAFGLHLIEVTKIAPEHIKSFAEVRNELLTAAKAQELAKDYLRIAEQLGNITYEHVDSLAPAAQALGLKIQHSDWISRSGGTGIFADARVIATAFADDVLTQGKNSELIEITEGNQQQALVLRVVDHTDATIPPLSEVKEQIITTLRQEQATKAAFKQAESLAERLRKGEAIDKVATGFSIVEQQLLQRDANKDVASEIIDAVFKIAKKSTASVDVIQTAAGVAVVILEEIQDGKFADLDEALRQAQNKELSQTWARNYYENMVDDLRLRADVWLAPQNERAVAIE